MFGITFQVHMTVTAEKVRNKQDIIKSTLFLTV